MFARKIYHNNVSQALVEVFSMFQGFAMTMILIVCSIKVLLFFKDNVLTAAIRSFVIGLWDRTPLDL